MTENSEQANTRALILEQARQLFEIMHLATNSMIGIDLSQPLQDTL